MSRQLASPFTIFLALTLIASSVTAMVLKPRRLTQSRPDKSSPFGSTGFLASMYLKKSLADSTGDFDPSNYNELIYNVIGHARKKELELFLIYQKTFQKDLSNKCKMAMLKGVADIRTSGEQPYYLARCEFVAETVFRNLHMSSMFYNLEFIIKTIRVMVRAENILMVFEGETEQQQVARNAKFFEVLEKVIAEVVLGSDLSWLARRFDMINAFYGPHFMAIFSAFIDDSEYQIHRHEIGLNPGNQELLEWGYNVPEILSTLEAKRLYKQERYTGAGDEDVYGVTERNLYRFYGVDYNKPFYNVKDFHMFMQD